MDILQTAPLSIKLIKQWSHQSPKHKVRVKIIWIFESKPKLSSHTGECLCSYPFQSHLFIIVDSSAQTLECKGKVL